MHTDKYLNKKFNRFRTKLSLLDAWPFLLIACIYFIDHKYYYIALYPLFLIPLLWITVRWGLVFGVSLAVLCAAISTPASTFIDWRSNLPYLFALTLRVITLSILVLFFYNYHDTVSTHKKRVERLKALIPQCPKCGDVFCADGQWRSLNALIGDNGEFLNKPKHDCIDIKLSSEPLDS